MIVTWILLSELDVQYYDVVHLTLSPGVQQLGLIGCKIPSCAWNQF